MDPIKTGTLKTTEIRNTSRQVPTGTASAASMAAGKGAPACRNRIAPHICATPQAAPMEKSMFPWAYTKLAPVATRAMVKHCSIILDRFAGLRNLPPVTMEKNTSRNTSPI